MCSVVTPLLSKLSYRLCSVEHPCFHLYVKPWLRFPLLRAALHNVIFHCGSQRNFKHNGKWTLDHGMHLMVDIWYMTLHSMTPSRTGQSMNNGLLLRQAIIRGMPCSSCIIYHISLHDMCTSYGKIMWVITRR